MWKSFVEWWRVIIRACGSGLVDLNGGVKGGLNLKGGVYFAVSV